MLYTGSHVLNVQYLLLTLDAHARNTFYYLYCGVMLYSCNNSNAFFVCFLSDLQY